MISTVTVLPSSPSGFSNSHTASNTSHGENISQRPKLSLNTTFSQRRTLGKGNTGLRLDQVPASSPTSRNTYRNSYDPPSDRLPTPLRGCGTSTSPPRSLTPCPSLQASEVEDSCSKDPSSQSRPTLSQEDQKAPAVPYVLGKHARSILTNSPLSRLPLSSARQQRRRRRSSSLKVGFCERIEESIQTRVYVAQHFDLLVSSPSADDKTSMKRESSRENVSREDSLNDDLCPETPVTGRKKRRRDWHWTLSPVCGTTNNDHQTDIASRVQESPQQTC